MSETIATLSGDPEGNRSGSIVETEDGYEARQSDGTVIGTLTESDLESLQEMAEDFLASEADEAPDLEGTAEAGQIGGPLGMMLQLSGHPALVLFNEDEREDGPDALHTAEDLLHVADDAKAAA